MHDTPALTAAMSANLLTMAEAAQRQCRNGGSAISTGPVPGQVQFAYPMCAGNVCANWRWHVMPARVHTPGSVHAEPRGCCGLAGEP